MKFICLILLTFVFSNSIVYGQLELIFADAGSQNGTCSSNTDLDNNVQCYVVSYTPSATGVLTSYDVSLIGNCIGNGQNYVDQSNVSCVMNDNSNFVDVCTEEDFIFIQFVGNTGNLNVTVGQPIIIHQFCFELSQGQTITLVPDEIDPINFSITDLNNQPINDRPTLVETPLVYEGESDQCFSNSCSISFSRDSMQVDIDTLLGGSIVNAAGKENLTAKNLKFDVFDETNQDCSMPGGIADISLDFEIIPTFDLSGNGLIDTFAGAEHKIVQDSVAIRGFIPFNTGSESESSPGDVRGYSVTVNFESHIGIIADQLTLQLRELNGANSVFESASIVFYDEFRQPYGTATYNGLFNGENDLTGNCLSTSAQLAYAVGGTGVVVVQDGAAVDLSLPCSPSPGATAGPLDSLSLNARLHAGLDSAAVISGFKVTFLGEDVAASTTEDRGLSMNGDDDIRANSLSFSTATLSSYLSEISIKNCVFEKFIVPLEWLSFEGAVDESSINLEWVTSEEINTSHFEVEWSLDAKTFTKIGQVQASSGSYPINTYSFKHRQAKIGINYYRLKQYDLDGAHNFSKVISVKKIGNRPNIVISPNPATTYVEFSSKIDAQTLSLFNIEGKKVDVKFTGSRSLDVSALSPGMYFAIVDFGISRSVHKLVIH